jgi:hypothetical protein
VALKVNKNIPKEGKRRRKKIRNKEEEKKRKKKKSKDGMTVFRWDTNDHKLTTTCQILSQD